MVKGYLAIVIVTLNDTMPKLSNSKTSSGPVYWSNSNIFDNGIHICW